MTDVLTVLSEANPVVVEDLTPLDPPEFASRRLPGRRLTLAIAVVAVAIAASLVGVFVFGRSGEPGFSGGTPAKGPTGWKGPTGPTIARPLPSGEKMTLPEAAGVLGVPLVLPETAFVTPRDIGQVWGYSNGPTQGIAAVTYPGKRMFIDYSRGVEVSDPRQIVASAKALRGARVIELSGVPAVAYEANDGTSFSSVLFAVHGTRISVLGYQDEATLVAVAQSIVDRVGAPVGTPGVIAPVRRAASLAALSVMFGSRVVMPQTSFVQPSDAVDSFPRRDCGRWCSVTVWFSMGGLSVRYSRAHHFDSRAGFEQVANNIRFGDGEVIDLNGTSALLTENEDAQGLGSISFVWKKARIDVSAYENARLLRDLAESILDQFRGTSSGPFTAPRGAYLFPVVPPRKRIRVAHASATLGSPVVLPNTTVVSPADAQSAWAEGQCPHASTSSSDGVSGCAMWVKFPAKSLTIVYERPGGIGPGVEGGQIGAMSGAHLVDLGGNLEALAVDRNAEGTNPGWLDFAIRGTRVIIRGDYDTATLQAIAQSIVDRSK